MMIAKKMSAYPLDVSSVAKVPPGYKNKSDIGKEHLTVDLRFLPSPHWGEGPGVRGLLSYSTRLFKQSG
jgi:hypothetical protein